MTPSRRNLLIGITIGIFFAGVLFYFRSTISEQGPPFLIGFLTCLALLGILLIIGGLWFQKQIYERFFGQAPTESNVNQSLKNTVGSFAKRYLPETTEKDVKSGVQLIQSFLWGRAVYTFIGVIISIFLVLGGLIGSVLLFKQNNLLSSQNVLFTEQNKLIVTQNEKLDSQISLLSHQNLSVDQQTTLLDTQTGLFSRQNDLVTDQNLKIDVQTGLFRNQNNLFSRQNEMIDTQNYRLNLQNNLIEADRRSSLVFLMSNILDKVDEEIKEQKDSLLSFLDSIPSETKFSLSKPLISRIVALSRAFRPYRMLEGDSLSELVSPERGQLFISLMENGLDSLTQNTIVEVGDFSFALIGKLNLRQAKLRRANLNYASLVLADLTGADLQGANLRGAIFRGATLVLTNFKNANLDRTDLRTTDLNGANLSKAKLSYALLNSATLKNAFLVQASLPGANLTDAKLNGAELTRAYVARANFTEVDMEEGILDNAHLNGVDFLNVKNLDENQLLQAISLYSCKNLPPKLHALLKSEKPCLFTKQGCYK